jgi:hypothetical protein
VVQPLITSSFLYDLIAMTAQLDNLRVIANKAAAAVNASSEALEFHF